MIILKLDFEMAFDKIEHEVIIQIMRRKGFRNKWIPWINGSLTSRTSSVLLNATIGKVFHCKRARCQVVGGGTLSPLLFVLAADMLQTIINKEKDIGLQRVPIDVGYSSNFPTIQYVDDTLLIMEACPQQLFTLKAILNTFVDGTGLKVNYSKYSIYPINISQEKISHLAATFNCQAGCMSFTYLGFPLSLNKHTIQDCLPLVHRIERRLISTSNFLSQRGKLQMINSCSWRGGDINGKKASFSRMQTGHQIKTERWFGHNQSKDAQ
jgi:hypothetical protein